MRKNQRLSNSLLDVCFSDETDLLSYAGGVLNRWLENRNTRVAYEAIAFQDGLLLIEVAWRAIIERDVALRLRALGWLSRALDHAASDKRLPYLHQLNATLRALAKYGRLLEGFEAAMRRGMWRIRGMTLLGRALLHAPSKQRQVDVEALCELLANAN